eukprot:871344-Rhodomonas_salina.1
MSGTDMGYAATRRELTERDRLGVLASVWVFCPPCGPTCSLRDVRLWSYQVLGLARPVGELRRVVGEECLVRYLPTHTQSDARVCLCTRFATHNTAIERVLRAYAHAVQYPVLMY